ncbi:hypothetical protein ATO6_04585 [Oceanicola sp. 22II-s10i]|uniref:DUF3576 domain-containing protein n=1 Tax=Oceanicola sp. 22II-s10i TaxID=1317116 RepID=UPI000B521106|nr:DUF3576 domain-containing protein [Oceanicola sp. 22II-s10i]OWU86138.1 hypothetical protein ATO6_04585 [Oceanicola sp. 22II-s10i]
MIFSRVFRIAATVSLIAALAACGNRGGLLPAGEQEEGATEINPSTGRAVNRGNPLEQGDGTSIFDILRDRDDGTKVAVNRYLWNASLDVLNFMPVQTVDPFTGVIVMGYGTPPGGGGSYRATVHISDPALEARSLHVSLQTRGGRPVSASTQRAVEDAILTRARQLRVGDSFF